MKLRRIAMAPGAIRLRRSLDDGASWKVETFGTAYKLSGNGWKVSYGVRVSREETGKHWYWVQDAGCESERERLLRPGRELETNTLMRTVLASCRARTVVGGTLEH